MGEGASTASPKAVNIREVRYSSSNEKAATVWEPSGNQPRAVLVCLHGIQSNHRWFELLGKELAGRGIAVWAYDRPNRVLHPGDKPIADAKDWREWVAQLEEVGSVAHRPGVPLIAVGVSWGARPVLASVVAHPAQWGGAILLNPALKTRGSWMV